MYESGGGKIEIELSGELRITNRGLERHSFLFRIMLIEKEVNLFRDNIVSLKRRGEQCQSGVTVEVIDSSSGTRQRSS